MKDPGSTKVAVYGQVPWDTHAHTHTNARIHTHKHTHTHAHPHTHTHTHTPMHIHTQPKLVRSHARKTDTHYLQENYMGLLGVSASIVQLPSLPAPPPGHASGRHYQGHHSGVTECCATRARGVDFVWAGVARAGEIRFWGRAYTVCVAEWNIGHFRALNWKGWQRKDNVKIFIALE
jgi:hypothetical protein